MHQVTTPREERRLLTAVASAEEGLYSQLLIPEA